MIVDRPRASRPEDTLLDPWRGSMSATSGVEEARPMAAISREAGDLQFVFLEALAVLQTLSRSVEVPEIFDLRPRSTEHIKVRIVDRGPAPFHLVTEESDLD